jgi:hypothetical protein
MAKMNLPGQVVEGGCRVGKLKGSPQTHDDSLSPDAFNYIGWRTPFAVHKKIGGKKVEIFKSHKKINPIPAKQRFYLFMDFLLGSRMKTPKLYRVAVRINNYDVECLTHADSFKIWY